MGPSTTTASVKSLNGYSTQCLKIAGARFSFILIETKLLLFMLLLRFSGKGPS